MVTIISKIVLNVRVSSSCILITAIVLIQYLETVKLNRENSFAEELLNDCRDSEEYASACPSLAKNGECTISSDFMKEFCKRSCDKCLSKN